MPHPLYFLKSVLKIVFRHPITGTTIIPVLPDGSVVFVLRRDTREWGLPGGMVDWGENLKESAARELAEETGLELLQIRRLVGVYSSFDRDPRIHSISILLEASVQGELQVKDTKEIIAVRAFSLDALPPGKLAHDHQQQLDDYLKGLTMVR